MALSLITALDPVLAGIVARSLAVSALACVIASGLGLLLGAWLGVSSFKGRGVVLALLNTALALPSVGVGLVVYLLLSRSGPLGYLGWLFSLKAMVLAQSVLVLTVLIAAFGRAISEVGAVMVVGGNIEGYTRVMTTSIALETSKGDLPLALALGIVLLGVVLLLNVLIALLKRWREQLDDTAPAAVVQAQQAAL